VVAGKCALALQSNWRQSESGWCRLFFNSHIRFHCITMLTWYHVYSPPSPVYLFSYVKLQFKFQSICATPGFCQPIIIAKEIWRLYVGCNGQLCPGGRKHEGKIMPNQYKPLHKSSILAFMSFLRAYLWSFSTTCRCWALDQNLLQSQTHRWPNSEAPQGTLWYG